MRKTKITLQQRVARLEKIVANWIINGGGITEIQELEVMEDEMNPKAKAE